MKILLIDDDVLDREIIKRSLIGTSYDHDVIEVGSAEDAIRLLQQSTFDIVIVDYNMPVMSGLDFVVQFKSLPEASHIAIVVVSNSITDDIILGCINAGAQDFLLKEEVSGSRLSRAMLQATRRFELEQKLFESYCHAKQLSESDSLTGLYNRHHFEDCLREAISVSERTKHCVTVFLIDLDHFKKINDSFGHEVGDQLLKIVAERISKKLRIGEKFARLGGDEFALIIENVDSIYQVKPVADRLLSIFALPFFIGEREIHCSGSIGVSICPHNGNKMEELVKYADIAMYRAKASGRNQYCVFEDNMQKEFFRKYLVERALRKALKENAFILHFQPLLATNDKRMVGVEALIRWPDPEINSFPDEFIPIAEESHIITELGRWVVQHAIERLAELRVSLQLDNLYMSINLSSLQLSDSGLVEFVSRNLLENKLKPRDLMLEITETALFAEEASSKSLISQFHELGCKIALDDFGTGYSSISHLLEFPIDVVKLHKSLIDGSTVNKRHATIMNGLCNMLNDLNTIIVAEGIEELEQFALCKACNVSIVQGYYFSKPLPEKELMAFVSAKG
jgi:diguanylate cyclase (GGDEF)-like protein